MGTQIEQLAPERSKLIGVAQPIEHLAESFGGAQGPATTIYFTSRNHLGSVNVKIPGLSVPTPKK